MNSFVENRTSSSTRAILQLSKYDDDQVIASTFAVHTDKKGYFMLVWRNSEIEAFLDVTGLVAAFLLPPVTGKIQYVAFIYTLYTCTHNSTSFSTIRPQNTKQFLTLVGDGSVEFASAVSAIQRIFRFMAQSFVAGELRPSPSPTLNDMRTIHLESRFVTPTEHNIFLDYPLTDVIDPRHILQAFVDTGKFKYTEDNVISCEELQYEEEDECVDLLIFHSQIGG